jgi:hypothetical protein
MEGHWLRAVNSEFFVLKEGEKRHVQITSRDPTLPEDQGPGMAHACRHHLPRVMPIGERFFPKCLLRFF